MINDMLTSKICRHSCNRVDMIPILIKFTISQFYMSIIKWYCSALMHCFLLFILYKFYM